MQYCVQNVLLMEKSNSWVNLGGRIDEYTYKQTISRFEKVDDYWLKVCITLKPPMHDM